MRAFHAAALAHGGKTAGDPGPRQAAFTTYFGAFIFDPDGNKIEAVYFARKLGETAGFAGAAKLPCVWLAAACRTCSHGGRTSGATPC